MSITMKLVGLIDKLKVQKFFIEDLESIRFLPIQIKFNETSIEKKINQLFKLNGHQYQANEFERKILDELDF